MAHADSNQIQTTIILSIDAVKQPELVELLNYLEQNFVVVKDILISGGGVNGSFTTSDSKTVTVDEGIISSIV